MGDYDIPIGGYPYHLAFEIPTNLQKKSIELREAKDRREKLNKLVQWALGNTKKSEG